jgi:two-component system CheB/CheR fusion protein
LVVVGIGSSAGGLEALQVLLSNAPDLENCAFVIAQHLSPTHKSMMVDLLSRTTDIPVVEVRNGLIIKPKTIYMTPENTDIYVKNGKLFLTSIQQSFGPKPSVNYFFDSLAQDFRERAIGVILSGTGSDGAHGVRVIKAEGGITMAQSPASAKYDGMPMSAINTGNVDLVIPIDKLAAEIYSTVTTLDKKVSLLLNDRVLQQIYRMLFDEHSVDFSLYKKNTIARRIERRLAALKIDTLQKYLDVLESSSQEINLLYHDILIGVTKFFRDKESYDKLKDYIDVIVSKKEQGEEIRFWSIGCSTGEEPYSLAILLSEALGEKLNNYKVKIFATDIDDEALKLARSGVYSETSLEGIDKELIKRYFNVQKNQFEVKKSLRELVVFSNHNVISDSPFLRLDLVSCRNLLIYFSNSLQDKFFPIVHYALKDNGILFLGKSESVGQHIDLFNAVDKVSKIFKTIFTGVKEPPKLFHYSNIQRKNRANEPRSVKIRNEEEYMEDMIIEALKEILLKNSVVLNASYDIIYIKGETPYLKPREGKVSANIFRNLDDELSLDLRSVIMESTKDKKVHITPFRSLKLFEDVIRYVRIFVTPVENKKDDDWLYILFFQSEEAQNIKGHILNEAEDSDIVNKLTLELDSTKSHLQNVIEELETSYEEMQSLNEELQSSNEELQSTNEELETTNEELQSTNEELQTAYSELRVLYDDKEKRTQQLESLTEKLSDKTEDYRKQKELTEGILDSAPVAIVLVDKDGKIIYANDHAEDIFELSKTNITQREYNSPEWKIKTFSGEDYDLEQLPFAIIKRTYEPVKNIQHTIEDFLKKKYLSINGSPRFDFDGQFQGAVFCVENLTDKYELQNDINFYEKNMGLDFENRVKNGDLGLLEMSILDISVSTRNILSELSLELNTIDTSDKDVKDSVKFANGKIESISTLLSSKVDFFTQKISYQTGSLLSVLKSNIGLFEQFLEKNKIECTIDFDESIDMPMPTRVVYDLSFVVFSFFLEVQSHSKAKESNILITNSNEKKYILKFKSNMHLKESDFSRMKSIVVEKLKPYGIEVVFDFDEYLTVDLILDRS